MYGYEILKLNILRGGPFRFIDIPQTDAFKIIVTGNVDDLQINILMEAEDSDGISAHEKLDQKMDNLKLYLNLFTDYEIDVKSKEAPLFFENKIDFDKEKQKSLDLLKNPNLSNFLNSRFTQQHLMLQNGLDEVFGGDMFNGFPKLINWLDDINGKPSSRFCKIRDVCSHGVTDDAILKVNEEFPGEFQFEDKIFRRNSQKNIKSMKKYLPEIIEQIRDIFKRDFVK